VLKSAHERLEKVTSSDCPEMGSCLNDTICGSVIDSGHLCKGCRVSRVKTRASELIEDGAGQVVITADTTQVYRNEKMA
jgi:hypothetical protein